MPKTMTLASEFSGVLGVMMSPAIRKAVHPTMTDRPKVSTRPAGAEDVRTVESSLDLLLRAKAGDKTALDALYLLYLPRLSRWAHGRLPPSSRGMLATEDIVQEVLVKAVQHVDTFQPRHEGSFGHYIRKTLLNRLRDEGRKGQRKPVVASLEDDHADDSPSPLEIAVGADAVRRYEAALERLKPQERELIIARVEWGFSAAEIAAEFGKPTAAAAQMAVSRALMRLAEEMTRGR